MQYVSRNGRTVRVNWPSSPARPSSWPRTRLRKAVAARTKKPAQQVVNLIRSVRHRIARIQIRLSDSGEIASTDLNGCGWRSLDFLAGIGRHSGPLDSNLSRAAIGGAPA